MNIREQQEQIRQKAQDSLTLASKLEDLGFDKKLVDGQIEIAEKLSKFADSVNPLIKRSQKEFAREEARIIYRDTVNEFPKIKKTIFLFIFLLIFSLLSITAIETFDSFFNAFVDYLSLLKAVAFLSLAPIILTLPILAYKTGIFILSSKEPTKIGKRPILFWIQELFWFGLSIVCFFPAWYWLQEFINA